MSHLQDGAKRELSLTIFTLHIRPRSRDGNLLSGLCIHLLRLAEIWLQDFPSLILRSQQYTHTNGAQVPLLMAEGTIPMYYQVGAPLLSDLRIYTEKSHCRNLQADRRHLAPLSMMSTSPCSTACLIKSCRAVWNGITSPCC